MFEIKGVSADVMAAFSAVRRSKPRLASAGRRVRAVRITIIGLLGYGYTAISNLEPVIDVVGNCSAAQLRSGIAATNEEPLLLAVLKERSLWPGLTTDDENPLALLIVKMRMDIRKEHLSNPILNEIDEVQSHLVLVREAIGIDPDDFAIISDADEQRAALGIQKARNCLERRQVHFFIGLTRVQVDAER